jgi:hypothetical protein
MAIQNYRSIGRAIVRLGFVPMLAGLLGSCTTSRGCRTGCNDIPAGAIPQPTGTHVRMINDTQAGKAEADDFVIYQHEWTGGGAVLGPRGRRHLAEIARRLPAETFPVLIETSDNEELDQTRRQFVLGQLAASDLADMDSRVTIGYPEAEGMSADDAARVHGGLTGSPGASASQTGTRTSTAFGGFLSGLQSLAR